MKLYFRDSDNIFSLNIVFSENNIYLGSLSTIFCFICYLAKISSSRVIILFLKSGLAFIILDFAILEIVWIKMSESIRVFTFCHNFFSIVQRKPVSRRRRGKGYDNVLQTFALAKFGQRRAECRSTFILDTGSTET